MIKLIGTLVGSATAALEDRLTAALSTLNASADGLRRDFLWVSGPSLVAVAPDPCVAAGESDRPPIKESQKVLIVEGWVHQLVTFPAVRDDRAALARGTDDQRRRPPRRTTRGRRGSVSGGRSRGRR